MTPRKILMLNDKEKFYQNYNNKMKNISEPYPELKARITELENLVLGLYDMIIDTKMSLIEGNTEKVCLNIGELCVILCLASTDIIDENKEEHDPIIP